MVPRHGPPIEAEIRSAGQHLQILDAGAVEGSHSAELLPGPAPVADRTPCGPCSRRGHQGAAPGAAVHRCPSSVTPCPASATAIRSFGTSRIQPPTSRVVDQADDHAARRSANGSELPVGFAPMPNSPASRSKPVRQRQQRTRSRRRHRVAGRPRQLHVVQRLRDRRRSRRPAARTRGPSCRPGWSARRPSATRGRTSPARPPARSVVRSSPAELDRRRPASAAIRPIRPARSAIEPSRSVEGQLVQLALHRSQRRLQVGPPEERGVLVAGPQHRLVARRGPGPRRPNRWPRQRSAAAARRRRRAPAGSAGACASPWSGSRSGSSRYSASKPPRIGVGSSTRLTIWSTSAASPSTSTVPPRLAASSARRVDDRPRRSRRVGLDAVDPEQVQVPLGARRSRPSAARRCGGPAWSGRRPASTPTTGTTSSPSSATSQRIGRVKDSLASFQRMFFVRRAVRRRSRSARPPAPRPHRDPGPASVHRDVLDAVDLQVCSSLTSTPDRGRTRRRPWWRRRRRRTRRLPRTADHALGVRLTGVHVGDEGDDPARRRVRRDRRRARAGSPPSLLGQRGPHGLGGLRVTSEGGISSARSRRQRAGSRSIAGNSAGVGARRRAAGDAQRVARSSSRRSAHSRGDLAGQRAHPGERPWRVRVVLTAPRASSTLNVWEHLQHVDVRRHREPVVDHPAASSAYSSNSRWSGLDVRVVEVVAAHLVLGLAEHLAVRDARARRRCP